MNKHSSRLGEMLISNNKITAEQLHEALLKQNTSNDKLGTILLQNGCTDESNVMKCLSYQTSIEIINLDNYTINVEAAKRISEKLARRTISIPLQIVGNRLLVAMNDPLNLSDIENIQLESGMNIEVAFALSTQIIEAIDKYMSRRNTELAANEISKNIVVEMDELGTNNASNDDYVKNSPVVKLINSLINQALKMDAS
ncbi:MAG: type II secretion system protein GspE, partial [Sedimentibacter sp.]